MGTTPTFQLPYPEQTEPADVALDIKELAQRVDAMLSQVSVTALPIGTPIPWLVTAIPGGYREFDGSAIVQGTHPLLFGLFGAVIPDLRDRVLLGASSGKPVGSIGGADAVALLAAEMPIHSHTVNSHSHGGGNHDHGTYTGTETADHSHSGQTGGQSAQHQHYIGGNSVAGKYGSSAGNLISGLVSYGGGSQPNVPTSDTLQDHSHAFGTGGRSAAHQHQITAQSVISAESPATNNQGGGIAHSNLQPYRSVRWITVAA